MTHLVAQKALTGLAALSVAATGSVLTASSTQAAPLIFDCYSISTSDLLMKSAIDVSSEHLACVQSGGVSQVSYEPAPVQTVVSQPAPAQAGGGNFLGSVIGGVLGGGLSNAINGGNTTEVHHHHHQNAQGEQQQPQPQPPTAQPPAAQPPATQPPFAQAPTQVVIPGNLRFPVNTKVIENLQKARKVLPKQPVLPVSKKPAAPILTPANKNLIQVMNKVRPSVKMPYLPGTLPR